MQRTAGTLDEPFQRAFQHKGFSTKGFSKGFSTVDPADPHG
jgi:hypothetical protein